LGGFGYYLVISDSRADRKEVAGLLNWLDEEVSLASKP
jgi:hypothetical protein